MSLESGDVTLAMLNEAALSVLGHELDGFTEDDLVEALDAQRFVDGRVGLGGVSAASTGQVLVVLAQGLERDRAWRGSIHHVSQISC